MQATKIQWTDMSVNPIRARRKDGKNRIPGHFCQKISAGCAHCYASKTQPRFRMPMFPGTNQSADEMGVEVFLDDAQLQKVLRRRKPAKIFWCDMSDMFGDWVPFEWVDKCFAVMALTPHLTHQILTKRPERMAEYLDQRDRQCSCDRGGVWVGGRERYVSCSACGGRGCYPSQGERIARIICQIDQSALADGLDRWWAWHQTEPSKEDIERYQRPLPNVWLGTSCENQQTADERIPHLLECPAAVRFISAEPLLGPINLRLLPGESDCFQWCIIGGESGAGARPCNVAWVRSIVQQCKAAGVAAFVKQLGAEPYSDKKCTCGLNADGHWKGPAACFACAGRLGLKDRKGGDPSEWPADLRVRELPKASVAR